MRLEGQGVQRITAVTTESVLKAMELGDLLSQEVDDASKVDVSLHGRLFLNEALVLNKWR